MKTDTQCIYQFEVAKALKVKILTSSAWLVFTWDPFVVSEGCCIEDASVPLVPEWPLTRLWPGIEAELWPVNCCCNLDTSGRPAGSFCFHSLLPLSWTLASVGDRGGALSTLEKLGTGNLWNKKNIFLFSTVHQKKMTKCHKKVYKLLWYFDVLWLLHLSNYLLVFALGSLLTV